MIAPLKPPTVLNNRIVTGDRSADGGVDRRVIKVTEQDEVDAVGAAVQGREVATSNVAMLSLMRGSCVSGSRWCRRVRESAAADSMLASWIRRRRRRPMWRPRGARAVTATPHDRCRTAADVGDGPRSRSKPRDFSADAIWWSLPADRHRSAGTELMFSIPARLWSVATMSRCCMCLERRDRLSSAPQSRRSCFR
jgi:hypothetical protein